MSTEIFSYSTGETSDIIGRTTVSGDFLHIPSQEFKTRDFEKESRHLLNLELHCATITEYLRVKRIPRGLRVNLRPTIFSDNKEFCTVFEQILNKCSLDLMTLTLEYLHKSIDSTKEKVTSVETQLESTLPSEEFSTMKEKLQSSLLVHKQESQKKKRQKFLRDTEDYVNNRVYRGHESFKPRPFRSYRSSSDTSLSGSDNGFRSRQGRYAPSFLGQGRPQGRRGRRGGGDSVIDTPRTNMTTRSQSILQAN
ncbi:translation machinery-associated protein 16 isoform 1-T2 [Anomaloglossus baeobatrachus]